LNATSQTSFGTHDWRPFLYILSFNFFVHLLLHWHAMSNYYFAVNRINWLVRWLRGENRNRLELYLVETVKNPFKWCFVQTYETEGDGIYNFLLEIYNACKGLTTQWLTTIGPTPVVSSDSPLEAKRVFSSFPQRKWRDHTTHVKTTKKQPTPLCLDGSSYRRGSYLTRSGFFFLPCFSTAASSNRRQQEG
jgi:hypothetical protein